MEKSIDEIAIELAARLELGEQLSPSIRKGIKGMFGIPDPELQYNVWFRGDKIEGPFSSPEEAEQASRDLYRQYSGGFTGFLRDIGIMNSILPTEFVVLAERKN